MIVTVTFCTNYIANIPGTMLAIQSCQFDSDMATAGRYASSFDIAKPG